MTPPPFTRILVLSRSTAAALDLGEPYAVVAFREPTICSLHSWKCKIPRRQFTLYCHDIGGGNRGAMTDRQAARAAAYIHAMAAEPDVQTLVVNCFAGISRSISLAFAVADHFNLGRACIDWRMKPHGIHDDPPNAHVYGLVREALKGEAT